MTTPFQPVRLRKHADYGLVYGASRKYQSASLSFFYRERSLLPLPDRHPSSARFGITVPKVLGHAPLRNRLKRRLRVVARAAVPLLPKHVDVVLHPRPVLATMAHAALTAEIAAVFRTVAERVAAGAPNTPLPRQPRLKKKPASKPAQSLPGAQGGSPPAQAVATHSRTPGRRATDAPQPRETKPAGQSQAFTHSPKAGAKA